MCRSRRHCVPVAIPFTVIVTLALAALSARQAEATGNLALITGRVLDAGGGPVAEAEITLTCEGARPSTVLSEPDGVFLFMGVRPRQDCRIAAVHPEFLSVEYDGLQVAPGGKRPVQFRLKHPGERDVVVLTTRDPFPPDALVRSFSSTIGLPVRVIDLDAAPDPGEAVRHVVEERPDLILGTGLRAARLIRREVHDIPVVLTLITDPRRFDLQTAVTCFLASNPSADDLLSRVTRILPAARRFGLIYDSETSTLVARDVREAARRAGLTVILRPIHDTPHLQGDLATLRGRVDALITLNDELAVSTDAREIIAAWALRNHLPLAACDPDWVRHGALFSYGTTLERIGEEAAGLASRLLFGDRHPEDLGLQTPQGHVLALNVEAAAALGVNLPPGTTADETF
jgi:ABC-type uncharacterized transport system substrate-binding protein